MANNKKGFITTGAMAFMTAAAIISLRGLPMMASEEMTMFFYIAFATIFFLFTVGSVLPLEKNGDLQQYGFSGFRMLFGIQLF